jgi:hypothetical protein
MLLWWIWAVWSGCGDGCPKNDMATYRCPDGECRPDCDTTETGETGETGSR